MKRHRGRVVCLAAAWIQVLIGVAGAADPLLEARWEFEGGYTDSSGKGHHGTPMNSPTFAEGKYGQSLVLNGSSQYVECTAPVAASTDGTGGLTLAAWIYRTVIGGDRKVVGNRSGNAGFKLSVYNNRLEMEVWDAGGQAVITRNDNSTLLTQTGEWVHVAGVFDDSADNVKEYVNGVLDATTAVTRSLVASTGPVRIGCETPDPVANRYFAGRIDDLRIYSGPLAESQIRTVMAGKEMQGSASTPVPAQGQEDVPRDVVLGWKAGPYAGTHDVYLGEAFEDVNTASRAAPKGVLASQGQTAATFAPADLLAFGRTYYWRVDEVNATPDATVHRGQVWGFTVEPYVYPIRPVFVTASSFFKAEMVPEKTIDGSGLDAQDGHSNADQDMWLTSMTDPGPAWIQYEFGQAVMLSGMWVWNANQSLESLYGFGAREVSVEVSTDGVAWTQVADVPEFARAPGSAGYLHNTDVDLGGVVARFVRLTIHRNWSTLGLRQCGLSEVRFFHVPVYAREPVPASGATGVTLDALLGWRPGREAVRHEVCFGTDPNALALAKTLTEHELALRTLAPEYGRTYFWQVAEVNDAAAVRSWVDEVWSFTTLGYGVVEDFESYDNACNRVYYAWKGGAGNSANSDCGVGEYGGNGTRSIVGNDAVPYAEQTLVHSGSQAMPLWYDNTAAPFYSEAGRDWGTARSWMEGGADTLQVYVLGEPVAYLETGPGSLMMNGIGTDIFGTADQCRFACKSLTGNGTIVARVEGLADTDAWALAGVMIRESLDAGSAYAGVFLTGNNGVRFRARATLNGGATSDTSVATAEQMALREPVWIQIERTGDVFRGFYSVDGQAWTGMAWNPQTIVMGPQVHIGLAVCSHTAAAATSGRFSGIATTGAVTGAFQSVDVGVAQPAGNAPDTLYVVVEDSAGRSRVVSHTDPLVIATGGWEEWNIPLGELTSAGLDLGGVRKVTVGVGNRSASKAGGAGKLVLDDLRLTRTGRVAP
ncbi:MAG: discoidin domain-containing protein [Phycisphaerae bacterium]|nr:discoidin domain-containing protein [Phycisphaerae bacterium]